MFKNNSNLVVNNYKSGPQRRYDLLVLIAQRQLCGDGLPVNNKWQLSTRDPDIKYLLKKGVINRFRRSTPAHRNLNTGLKKSGKGQTYLILNKIGD